MTGTAQEVAELRKAEEKLFKLAAIVESTSDAIISKTLDGFITSWNKQAEKLFGYTEKEALGKHISIIFPKDRLPEENEILKNIKEGTPLIAYETERIHKDGTIISISATISPIRDSKGTIIAVSKIVRDITEKKQADAKIERYLNVLQQKNKEPEQFAYIASHDLQEPLRTITNYIGLFYNDYKGKLDKDADVYLDFIRSASKRIQILISDILEYTRIENNNEQTTIDTDLLIKEILTDLEKKIQETGAKIEVFNLPSIIGYSSRIKSLFQNLITNAIKFRKPNVDLL